jgi:hypothetical protein
MPDESAARLKPNVESENYRSGIQARSRGFLTQKPPKERRRIRAKKTAKICWRQPVYFAIAWIG